MTTRVPLILQLNDDCLWCIFAYLDLPELLIAGSVCQRFKGIAQMFYKNYPSVDFRELSVKFHEKRIRRPKLSDVFTELEHHLIAMRIYGLSYENTFGRPGYPISTFPNLQHLFLGYFDALHEDFANVFPALKQVVLHWNKRYDSWGPMDDEGVINRWFKKLPHLKIIKFSNIDMTGECLVGLKGIEEIRIKDCGFIESNFFEQFCKLNPQLKRLSFQFNNDHLLFYSNGTRNTDNFLKIITKYLKNLESLDIIDDIFNFEGAYDQEVNYEILRELPKVTKLRAKVDDINQQFDEFHHFLEHFANNNHIEHLNLPYAFEYALERLPQFTYLKVLKLSFYIENSFENVSNSISCTTTLEELHLLDCDISSFVGLKEFIQKFKSLRLLNVCGSTHFTFSVLTGIDECLHNRTQVLEMVIYRTRLALELQMEPKSDFLTDFLDRTKGKLKFTINGYTDYGMPKKSFHEWDECAGDWPTDSDHPDSNDHLGVWENS